MSERLPYPDDHKTHMPVLIGIGLKVRIRSVLEFGAGLASTPLFLNRDIFPDLTELVSVERDPEWTAKVREQCPDGRITISPEPPVERSHFDLVFVDCAEASARVALIRHLVETGLPRIMVLHDSENPTYRAEFSRIPSHYDLTFVEPHTSIVWNPDRGADIAGPCLEIDALTRSRLDVRVDDVAEWVRLYRQQESKPSRLSVSVSMVGYRRHRQTASTFESYLKQARLPDEIIYIEDGYDGGDTERICQAYSDRLPIKYFCRRNRPNVNYSNSSLPRNIGIRKAVGDILVMQNPEVRFTKPTDFANIVGPTEANPMIATYAPCEALDQDGRFKQWYQDPSLWSYNCFCSAHRHAHLVAIGGFDEAYRGYGYEDNDWNFRYIRTGITQVWAKDVVTQHQWHEVTPNPNERENEAFNKEYSAKQLYDILDGKRTLESNVGIEWGKLE